MVAIDTIHPKGIQSCVTKLGMSIGVAQEIKDQPGGANKLEGIGTIDTIHPKGTQSCASKLVVSIGVAQGVANGSQPGGANGLGGMVAN